MEVKVHDGQVEKALKILKRQMAKEGLLKELKKRKFYEKPSVKKRGSSRKPARRGPARSSLRA